MAMARFSRVAALPLAGGHRQHHHHRCYSTAPTTSLTPVVPPPTGSSVSDIVLPTRGDCPVPIAEGNGDYIRNTTLSEPLPGYSRRWRWYAGHLVNDVILPFASESAQSELSRGSWFAVPKIGRQIPGTPRFHVITANHVVHPFAYPDLYDFSDGGSLELIRHMSQHDVSCKLYTATPDGERSSSFFSTVPDLTYAHPLRHLDLCVLHPSSETCDAFITSGGAFRHEASQHARKAGITSSKGSPASLSSIHPALSPPPEETEGYVASDSVQFPFHFQLLSFDSAPLREGEKVMSHGHSVNRTVDLTPLMYPKVMRCSVVKSVTSAEDLGGLLSGGGSDSPTPTLWGDSTGYVIIESDGGEAIPHGMCGGPILRDGRIVGMVVASLIGEPHKALCLSGPSIRSFLLRIEEGWRYPAPPSSNWLRENGLISGEVRRLPTAPTDSTKEDIPERYLPNPGILPQRATSRRLRGVIRRKFLDPLPENFQPPLVGDASDASGRRSIVSRDRTNPYGELPADSGLHIPSLQLFPGYPSDRTEAGEAGLPEGDDHRPGWLLKYGSVENYLKAHGVDPAEIPSAISPSGEKTFYVDTGVGGTDGPPGVTFFKNHLQQDDGGAGAGLLADGSDAGVLPHALPGGGATPLLSGGEEGAAAPQSRSSSSNIDMSAFFGEEEYSEKRSSRVKGEATALLLRIEACESRGGPADLAEAAVHRGSLHALMQREEELAWHRGDVRYESPESRALSALPEGIGSQRMKQLAEVALQQASLPGAGVGETGAPQGMLAPGGEDPRTDSGTDTGAGVTFIPMDEEVGEAEDVATEADPAPQRGVAGGVAVEEEEEEDESYAAVLRREIEIAVAAEREAVAAADADASGSPCEAACGGGCGGGGRAPQATPVAPAGGGAAARFKTIASARGSAEGSHTHEVSYGAAQHTFAEGGSAQQPAGSFDVPQGLPAGGGTANASGTDAGTDTDTAAAAGWQRQQEGQVEAAEVVPAAVPLSFHDRVERQYSSGGGGGGGVRDAAAGGGEAAAVAEEAEEDPLAFGGFGEEYTEPVAEEGVAGQQQQQQQQQQQPAEGAEPWPAAGGPSYGEVVKELHQDPAFRNLPPHVVDRIARERHRRISDAESPAKNPAADARNAFHRSG